MEEIVEKEISFDDHFVTLQNENYDRGSKRLKIERIQLSNKKVVDKRELNVDLSLVVIPGLMKLHQVGGEVLVNFIGHQQTKNQNLKEKNKIARRFSKCGSFAE